MPSALRLANQNMERMTENMEHFVDWSEQLLEGVCTIEFTKTNGEKRIMRATLHPSYLPQPVVSEEPIVGTNTYNPEYLRVWDIEKDGWRSFRIDTVYRFNGREVTHATSGEK